VGDLGYFENEDIARALSKKRSYALHTIVVQNEEVRFATARGPVCEHPWRVADLEQVSISP
jgi:hypothetical protein